MPPRNKKKFRISNKRSDIVNVEHDLSLLDVSADVIRLVGSWQDIKSKGRLANTCKTTNNLFQSKIDDEAKPFINTALDYAAFGEKDELDTLLTKHPGLIFKKGKITDPCGRIIHGTVYQIALGAKDWNPYPENEFEEMVEMIERHMKLLPKGKEEIELQKAEQFPKGWEEQEKIREANDSAAIKKVFDVIDKANSKEDCNNAIDEFIKYLHSQNECKTGYHFNDKLLIEAKELYNHYYSKFGGVDDENDTDDTIGSYKNSLASIKVLGNIQRRMPACLAMAHCDGISNITTNRSKLSRRLTLSDESTFFSPHLGHKHFVYSNHIYRSVTCEAELWGIVLRNLKSYVQKKQAVSIDKVPHYNNQNQRYIYRG